MRISTSSSTGRARSRTRSPSEPTTSFVIEPVRTPRKPCAAGITTIRDLGDRNFVTLDLRDDPDLPTILAAGPPLTADGGHCWYLGGCCRDQDELIAAVHDRKARGCDIVKIMVTGGSLTPSFPMWAPQFTSEDIQATVAVAHALGLPVAAHCHGVEGIVQSLDAGVDTIEHCTFYAASGSAEPDDVLIERIAASGTPVSATWGVLPGYAPPPRVEANAPVIRAAIQKIHALGGTVVVGTDGGIVPGKPHDVLPYAGSALAAIGLTPPEILTTLTTTAATVCGVGDRKGRIAPGYDADLLAVEGDPLTNIDNLTLPAFVMSRGRRIR